MQQKSKKNEQSTVDESPEQEYYPKYIADSGGGAITINITISGNNNNVRVLSGQAPPPPKPPGH